MCGYAEKKGPDIAKSFRIAVVGYGRWGHTLAKALDAHPRFELARICYRSAPSNAQMTPRLSDILDDPTIDAVAVATPLEARPDIIQQCLTANKHVLSEKPLGRSRQEAERLAAVAHDHRRILFTNYVHAYGYALEQLCADIEHIGPLQEMNVVLAQPGPVVRGEDIASVLGSHAIAILFRLLTQANIPRDVKTITNVRSGGAQQEMHRWVWQGTLGDRLLIGFTVDLGYPFLQRRVDLVGQRATVTADTLLGKIYRLDASALNSETRSEPEIREVRAGDDLSSIFEQFANAIDHHEQTNTRLALEVQAFLEETAPTSL